MRKGYSLLLLLICFSEASAQNWAPINTTDKYNYKLDTASAISHTLWVDSVQVVGGDTVYFMNRIVKAISDSIALKNQPQFLQKQVVVKSSGGYIFNSPNSIGYSTTLAIGDSVIYDSTNNISAKVIAADTATVLSNPDSIKTLLLSSGDTIIVSKNYGFVQYPYAYGSHKYYRLVGIEGARNVGEHMASNLDFFAFEAGDVFEYTYRADNVDDAPPYLAWVDLNWIIEIDSKQVSVDSITYNFHDVSWESEHYQTGTNTTIIKDTFSWGVKKYTMYPNLLYPAYFIDFGFLQNFTFNQFCHYNTWYKTGKSFKDAQGRTVTLFNKFYNQWTGDTLLIRTIDSLLRNTYVTGLGFVNFEFDCFEHDSYANLTACKTSIYSYGVFDSVPNVGIGEADDRLKCRIYPNPINEVVYFDISIPATIRLLDLSGSEVLVQQSNDGHISINTSSLPAGLYIVEVRTKDGVGRKKVIKL